jgi:SAM-dependent methyltransferase
MRNGWETEAANWAAFARTPGYDRAHEQINLPPFLALLPEPGLATLDLGCGEGRLSRLLAGRGHRMVGVDAAPTIVRFAATHQQAQPVIQGDAAALPFRDEAFDLVVAYMCLHDIDAMPDAVAEAGRLLRPGGRLCAAIPHPVNTAGGYETRDGDARFVITESYLDAHPTQDAVERGGIRLTFHSEHRPVEAYSRALERAGLLIEAIREVRAPDEVVARNPAQRRWQRIPLFLHLRAVKPSGATARTQVSQNPGQPEPQVSR